MTLGLINSSDSGPPPDGERECTLFLCESKLGRSPSIDPLWSIVPLDVVSFDCGCGCRRSWKELSLENGLDFVAASAENGEDSAADGASESGDEYEEKSIKNGLRGSMPIVAEPPKAKVDRPKSGAAPSPPRSWMTSRTEGNDASWNGNAPCRLVIAASAP